MSGQSTKGRGQYHLGIHLRLGNGPAQHAQRNHPLPDHGRYGDPTFYGGAFFNYDAKYFRETMLSQFRSPDYGAFDVIVEVAPKAKARGMDFFCWDSNNERRRMLENMPNAIKVTEVDFDGRRMVGPCFNHPDYRAHSARWKAICVNIQTRSPESRGAASARARSKR